jgi:hypothetical protein
MRGGNAPAGQLPRDLILNVQNIGGGSTGWCWSRDGAARSRWRRRERRPARTREKLMVTSAHFKPAIAKLTATVH